MIDRKDLLAMINASIDFVKEQLEKEKDPDTRLVMNGEIMAYEHIRRCVEKL